MLVVRGQYVPAHTLMLDIENKRVGSLAIFGPNPHMEDVLYPVYATSQVATGSPRKADIYKYP